MPSHRRIHDRAVIAKLSDARERLHHLIARAREVHAERHEPTWPHDLNADSERGTNRG
jgi:hypothetical protein